MGCPISRLLWERGGPTVAYHLHALWIIDQRRSCPGRPEVVHALDFAVVHHAVTMLLCSLKCLQSCLTPAPGLICENWSLALKFLLFLFDSYFCVQSVGFTIYMYMYICIPFDLDQPQTNWFHCVFSGVVGPIGHQCQSDPRPPLSFSTEINTASNSILVVVLLSMIDPNPISFGFCAYSRHGIVIHRHIEI